MVTRPKSQIMSPTRSFWTLKMVNLLSAWKWKTTRKRNLTRVFWGQNVVIQNLQAQYVKLWNQHPHQAMKKLMQRPPAMVLSLQEQNWYVLYPSSYHDRNYVISWIMWYYTFVFMMHFITFQVLKNPEHHTRHSVIIHFWCFNLFHIIVICGPFLVCFRIFLIFVMSDFSSWRWKINKSKKPHGQR